MPLVHVTFCGWARAVRREVANVGNRMRQVDNSSAGLWLQKLFQSPLPDSVPALDPCPHVAPGCPDCLATPRAFFGSPSHSDCCPSTCFCQAVSGSSGSLVEWTEYQKDSHVIRF